MKQRMKRAGHLKEIAYDPKTLAKAVKAAKKSKRVHSLFMRGKITSDSAVAEIISDFNFHADYTPITVQDESSQKIRQAFKPSIHDVLVQNAFWLAIKEPIRRGTYRWSCGAIEGRGPDRLAMHVRKIVKRDPKRARYWLKLDFRHCYPTIDRRILRNNFLRVVKDPWAIEKFDQWMSGLPGKTGVCIGDLISKEMANFHLTPLDHLIKEKLGTVYYHRYMDDMLLIGPSKRSLQKAAGLIADYCKKSMNAELHLERGHVKTIPYVDKNGIERGEPIDMCGYRIYRTKVSMRRRVSIKTRRSLMRQWRKPSVSRAKSIVSRYGRYLRRTDHFVLDERYHARKVFEECKQLLRRQSHAKTRSSRIREPEAGGGDLSPAAC